MDELKDRIEAKKHELLAKISEMKADSRAEVKVQHDKLRAKLHELETHLKDGWDKVTNDVAAKLNEWLKN
jgi:hypothetical protein